ncbi:UNVERIFIED_CONTAM: Dhc64C [Trichonephila clavipes]
MADSLEGSGSQPPSVSQPVTSELADTNVFINYIKRVVPVLLEDDDEVHPALLTALSDKTNLEILKKFIGDPQCRALLIQRSSSKEN